MLKIFKNIPLWFHILLALLLRLVCMPIAMHPDFLSLNFIAHLISFGGVWDPYLAFQNTLPMGSESALFAYDPLILYIISASQIIFKPLFMSFELWMQQGFLYHTHLGSLSEVLTILESKALFINLFLVKVPYLVFDLLGMILLWYMLKAYPEEKRRFFFLGFWLYNPILFYSTYLFAGFDVVPAVVTLGALWAVSSSRHYIAMGLLACGFLCKHYPLLFVLPSVMVLSENWRERIKLLGMFAVVCAGIMLPFLLHSSAYYHLNLAGSVLQGFVSGDTKSFSYETLEKLVKIFPFFLVLYLGIIYWEFRQGMKDPVFLRFVRVNTLVLFACYAFVALHFHYFVWGIPFMLFFCLEYPRFSKIYAIQILCVAIYKLKRHKLTTGILAPLNPEFFMALPGLRDIMERILPWGGLVRFSKLVFVGTFFYMVYFVFKELRNKKGSKLCS